MGVERQRFTGKNTYILQGEERTQTRFARMDVPRFDGHEPLEYIYKSEKFLLSQNSGSRAGSLVSFYIDWVASTPMKPWKRAFFFSWKELTKAVFITIWAN